MENAAFSFGAIHSTGDQAVHFPGSGGIGESIKAKQSQFNGTGDWGAMDYLCSDYKFSHDCAVSKSVIFGCKDLSSPDETFSNPVHMEMQSLQDCPKFSAVPDCDIENSWVADTMELDELKCFEEHVEPKKEKVSPISLENLELLKNYRAGCKRLNGEKLIDSSNDATCPTGGRRLSTEDVMRIAGAHYIQLSVHVKDDLSMLSMLPSLTDEEIKDVELANLLLATAEKISNRQYDRARKLLTQCYYLSSNVGNPVQRVVHHFAVALEERIDRETGRISSKGTAKDGKWVEAIEDNMMDPHPALVACHERIPFSQAMQFTETQTILDDVGSAKKLHFIDLGLRIGIQWTTLMQALAVRTMCPLVLLKISAVGTSEEKLMKTKKWLESFAETLNLPFSFKAVVVSDMKDIKENLFELEADEMVGVSAPMILRTMLVRPDCLENLMKVMKNLNPFIMTVTEVEADHNSPSFINRFTEALFFYSAWFDVLNTCMDRNDDNRMSVEEDFFSHGLRSIIATEGSERIIRHVGIDVWRSFFKRCGFIETDLTQVCLDQAKLVVKQFSCGSCCTLDMNGKALTVGWKVFSFSAFDCNGSKDVYCPIQEFRRYEKESKGKQTHFFGAEDWADFDHLCSNYDFYQERSSKSPSFNNQHPVPDIVMEEDMQPDVVSAIIQELEEPHNRDAGLDCTQNSLIITTPKILDHKKEKVNPLPLASLELLNSYGTGQRLLNGEKLNNSAIEEPSHVVIRRKLSTEEVMRVASARYIQFSAHRDDDHFMLGHPFGSMFSSLTNEETKDVELAHLLLASSEKIGNQQYDRASRLLMQCEYMSSKVGNPVQRVVHYFTEALHERINRETGRLSSKVPESGGLWGEDVGKAMIGEHPAFLAGYQMMPFGKVMQFTAIQSIIDNVASAKKVHLIDFGIKFGLQWAVVMQALAERSACAIERLKITAVATLQMKIEETGKRLVSFAKTLNLPFTFKPIIVSDMKDLNGDMFELEPEEVVGVYAPTILNHMIFRPDCLEHLMRVIRSLKPCIMAVTEVDANHNSPSFFNRFTEALFHSSAWFDCFHECMDGNEHDRLSIESEIFSHGIMSIVATEGSERIVRHVTIDVWRSFFTRFGFVEVELNHLSLYQAGLLTKQFACGSSCTLDMNGKSLSIGWKGTPLLSASAWKLK